MKPDEACNDQATDNDEFWLRASEPSLNVIWDNSEDDIYAELLDASMIVSGIKC